MDSRMLVMTSSEISGPSTLAVSRPSRKACSSVFLSDPQAVMMATMRPAIKILIEIKLCVYKFTKSTFQPKKLPVCFILLAFSAFHPRSKGIKRLDKLSEPFKVERHIKKYRHYPDHQQVEDKGTHAGTEEILLWRKKVRTVV